MNPQKVGIEKKSYENLVYLWQMLIGACSEECRWALTQLPHGHLRTTRLDTKRKEKVTPVNSSPNSIPCQFCLKFFCFFSLSQFTLLISHEPTTLFLAYHLKKTNSLFTFCLQSQFVWEWENLDWRTTRILKREVAFWCNQL